MKPSHAELDRHLKEWAKKVDLLLEQASKRVENEQRRAAILEAQNNLYRAQASQPIDAGVTKRADGRIAAPISEAPLPPQRDSNNGAIAAVAAPKALDASRLAMIKEASCGLDIAYLRGLEDKGRAKSSAALPPSSHAAQQADEPGSSLVSHVPLQPSMQAAIRETAKALDLAYMRRANSPRRSRSSVQADVVMQSQLAAGSQQSLPSTAQPRSSQAELLQAAAANDSEAVAECFKQDTSGEAFSESFTSALQLALASGSNEVVRTLLESHSKELEQRVYRHNLQAQLLQRQASQRLNALDAGGRSALSTLLRRPDAEEKLVVMLLQAKADPLQKEVGGSTAFHACAEAGHVNILRLLTSYTNGSSLGVYDARGRTALHQAAAAGHSEAVQVLLQMKADAAACDLALQMPVDLAQDAKVLQLLRPSEEVATPAAEPAPPDGDDIFVVVADPDGTDAAQPDPEVIESSLKVEEVDLGSVVHQPQADEEL